MEVNVSKHTSSKYRNRYLLAKHLAWLVAAVVILGLIVPDMVSAKSDLRVFGGLIGGVIFIIAWLSQIWKDSKATYNRYTNSN
jgi:ABC-type enterochelin transport system permease subunit